MTTKKAAIVAERLFDSIKAIETRVTKQTEQIKDNPAEVINHPLLFENDLNVTIALLDKSYQYQNKQKSFNIYIAVFG